ncbi:hypothetical protein TUN199_08583 [Pyrenophora tritici-repentis]|uniref:Uncharacterized protein n=1 Tax=Pyrenophora tritici-repentis TaxID=45151 RepID=A0A834VLS9_9PLEO|nr:hypothetical protein A1F99_083910 [Pyrenophora tritici-repentis]KAF7569226.1 hypothetical protein PtrM4_116410 [Pyrenophora tritici-repentis]KAI0574115.1 hypothetical protein Alg130_09828 [Pyrenophora tritici-repentis]KAI0619438.1 hypothetical protein TUN199_08583 [Pyrenophora tritici-repentis]
MLSPLLPMTSSTTIFALSACANTTTATISQFESCPVTTYSAVRVC